MCILTSVIKKSYSYFFDIKDKKKYEIDIFGQECYQWITKTNM